MRIERGKLPAVAGALAAGLVFDREHRTGTGLQPDRGELVDPLGEELLVEPQVRQLVGAGASQSGQHRQRSRARPQRRDGRDLTPLHHYPPP